MSIRKLAFPALAAAMALAVTACDQGDEETYGQSDEATMQEDTSVAQDQGTANEPGAAGSPTGTTDSTYGEEPLPDEEESYAHADSGEQHGRPVGRTGDADESTGRIGEDADTTGDVGGMTGESMADLPEFDEVDSDGDGRISREEASSVTGLEDSFEQIDANNDDHLSNDEYEQAKDEA